MLRRNAQKRGTGLPLHNDHVGKIENNKLGEEIKKRVGLYGMSLAEENGKSPAQGCIRDKVLRYWSRKLRFVNEYLHGGVWIFW